MATLTMELAKELVARHVTAPHLMEHALAVSAAMEAMAVHFGADSAYWAAVGYAHDVDYEQWPEEHLQHTRPILEAAGVDEETIRAILAHGWGVCSDVEPVTDLEKSLYTVDSLTGLVSAAAKIDRSLIKQGCEMLGMDMAQVMQICIDGMRPYADQLGIGPREN